MSEILNTERLTLRTFRADDAPAIQVLLAPIEITRMTGSIPHPYPDGFAAQWIAQQPEKRAAGEYYNFAIDDGQLAGCMGLFRKGCATAGAPDTLEIGYWIGVPFWGRGYASEAAAAIIAYGFETLKLKRIVAGCFVDNPGSQKVLRKLGFVETGRDMGKSVARGGEAPSINYALTREAWKGV